MSTIYESDLTALTQTFTHTSKTHSYTIKHTSLGSPTSQPLIFIHGTPWSSRLWTPYAIALSQKYHVHLFDRPGFGDSSPEERLPGAPAPKSKEEEYDSDLARQSEVFAALYKEWEKEWNGQKPHIIAHDNAGLLSLRAFLLHECEYASLCLINVVAIGPFGQSLFKSLAEAPELFEQLPDMAFEGILESYIRNAAYHELPKDVLEMLKAPWLRKGGKRGFIREMCQANYRSTDEVEGRYKEVGSKIPVKVIWGANDNWIPVESARRLGDALRAREVKLVDQAGHLSLVDQSAQVGIEFATWLNEVQK